MSNVDSVDTITFLVKGKIVKFLNWVDKLNGNITGQTSRPVTSNSTPPSFVGIQIL